LNDEGKIDMVKNARKCMRNYQEGRHSGLFAARRCFFAALILPFLSGLVLALGPVGSVQGELIAFEPSELADERLDGVGSGSGWNGNWIAVIGDGWRGWTEVIVNLGSKYATASRKSGNGGMK